MKTKKSGRPTLYGEETERVVVYPPKSQVAAFKKLVAKFLEPLKVKK